MSAQTQSPLPALEIEPLAAHLGAVVHGVDLANVDDATFAALHAAWLEHQVLFFRDQALSLDEHKAFGARFGELHVHPVLHPLKDEGHPEIVVLESNEKLPFVAEGWHSDVTFEKAPPLGSILRCRIAPETGGDTLWASMYAAYEGLSDSMQRLLSGLEARHDGGGFAAIARTEEQRKELKERQTAVHPVIRTHPETGRKVLFVNSAFTREIVGMKRAESQAILEFLYRHIETPDFQVRFRWQPDSIAFWDNRCTQHRVLADNLAAHRRMERVTMIGDVPVA